MIKNKLKTCKSCGLSRYIFSRGRCKACAQREDYKPISHSGKSRIIKPAASGELNRWFLERRQEMTGRCAHCGNQSCRDDDQYFKFSIAHILPKNFFKSIKTHPDNWIELCFWGERSCHSQLDHSLLDMIELNCWDTVVTKFQSFYPDIHPLERRRIPHIFSNYMVVDM
jgi:hypothetical protein